MNSDKVSILHLRSNGFAEPSSVTLMQSTKTHVSRWSDGHLSFPLTAPKTWLMLAANAFPSAKCMCIFCKLADFFSWLRENVREKRGKKTLDFFSIIKLCLGDDVLAVCGPGEVFIALLESCCAALIAEIMGENGTQRTVLMTPTRQENSEDK